MARSRRKNEPNKNFVGFFVGEVGYAFPIADVREIIHPLDVSPLPDAPETVLGVANVRGELVTVVDLRERFRKRDIPRGEMGSKDHLDRDRSKWIVLHRQQHLVAAVVDRVTDVFGGSADPYTAGERGMDRTGITGVLRVQGEIIFVVDRSLVDREVPL